MNSVDVPNASHERQVSLKTIFQDLKVFVLGRFYELFLPRRNQTSFEITAKKPYEPPALRNPTLDQAKLIVIGHALVGNQDAKELMDLVFS